jgi:polyhydroxyalkanoate synthesis regulator phasin
MLDDMRKVMRAGIDALAGGRSDEVAATLVERAQAVAEQISGLASGFLEWSAEARASLRTEVRELVARQVREMGVATKREVDALRRRIERLEEAGRGPAKATSRGAASTAKARRADRSSRTTAKRPSRSARPPRG